MFDIVQRIVETLGIVTIIGLAYHAGIMSNRVTALEKIVENVGNQFNIIDKKLDRVVQMLFSHVDEDNRTRDTVLRERQRHDEMDKD